MNITNDVVPILSQFKLAVDNAFDQILITDANGVIVYANSALERITGFTQAEAIGKKAGSSLLWGGLMPSEFYAEMWDTIKNKQKPFIGEVKNRRKSGEIYFAQVSISPIVNPATKQVESFVSIERDITDIKELEKTKTEFLSLASHQLRTPLSTINWYSEVLDQGDLGKLNELQNQYVTEIRKAAARMIEIITTLLDVSRIELGTINTDVKDVIVQDCVNNVLSSLAPQTEKRMQKIVKHGFDHQIKMITDPHLLETVIDNLLTNATKYTPESGTITIDLELEKVNQNELVKIMVTDTGYGIPEQQQDQIFKKMFRADNIRLLDTDGTGVGLYLVKQVVTQMGGTINFTSEQNKGSCFIVKIPVKTIMPFGNLNRNH